MHRKLRGKSSKDSSVAVAAEVQPRRWLPPLICFFLAAITLAVFEQAAHFDFVNFDDDIYVTDNATVASGLSFKGLLWVFSHFDCSLYHPLTMLSLMADYQLHGLHAGGYHLTNVLLHMASVVLLFLFLRQMTGAMWRSAFVAAVFAIHPLRVESVAWVAERKDVLAAFFFMLTLGAYVHYVRKPASLLRYLVVVAAYVAALLSKPTVVTLPFVLLLLDWWPLRRMESQKISKLILEKLPLLALAAMSCVMTVLAAQHWIATRAANISMSSRLGNAIVSYAVYLRQMVWPRALAAFYPQPDKGHPLSIIAISFLVLAFITAGVFVFGRKRRWLVVGWLWYLGMLAPMIGIVQTGPFAHADRMTYLPQIGLYLLVTWTVVDWCAGWRFSPVTLGGLAAIILIALGVGARNQTASWRDSETMWTTAIANTSGNDLAYNDLGVVFFKEGKVDEAIGHFRKALEIRPGYPEAQNNLAFALLRKEKPDEAMRLYQNVLQFNPDYVDALIGLGNAFMQKGRVDDAMERYRRALQLQPGNTDAQRHLGDCLLQKGNADESMAHYRATLQTKPDDAQAHHGLGIALLRAGKIDDAIAQYRQALQLKPDFAEARGNLGSALFEQGKTDEAITEYQAALQLTPKDSGVHKNLGVALMQKGKVDEAIVHFQQALKIDPNYAEAHFNLGVAWRQKGKTSEAISEYQKALQIDPSDVKTENNLAWLLATDADAALRNGPRALELAQQANHGSGGTNPIVLHTLAAAFAETGKYDEAKRTVKQAMDAAPAAGRKDLLVQLTNEFKRYDAGLALHP